MNRGQHVINKLKGNSLPQKDRIKKWKIVTGDLVEMRYGEDKGKQGQVVKVLRKKNRLVVKGVNITKRHVRGNMKGGEQQGGYWYAEAPVHYSRVALVDPSTGKATKIKYEIIEGVKTRVARDSQIPIPKPTEFYKHPDRKKRLPGPKDTSPTIALEKTFDEETLNPLSFKSVHHKETSIQEATAKE